MNVPKNVWKFTPALGESSYLVPTQYDDHDGNSQHDSETSTPVNGKGDAEENEEEELRSIKSEVNEPNLAPIGDHSVLGSSQRTFEDQADIREGKTEELLPSSTMFDETIKGHDQNLPEAARTEGTEVTGANLPQRSSYSGQISESQPNGFFGIEPTYAFIDPYLQGIPFNSSCVPAIQNSFYYTCLPSSQLPVVPNDHNFEAFQASLSHDARSALPSFMPDRGALISPPITVESVLASPRLRKPSMSAFSTLPQQMSFRPTTYTLQPPSYQKHLETQSTRMRMSRVTPTPDARRDLAQYQISKISPTDCSGHIQMQPNLESPTNIIESPAPRRPLSNPFSSRVSFLEKEIDVNLILPRASRSKKARSKRKTESDQGNLVLCNASNERRSTPIRKTACIRIATSSKRGASEAFPDTINSNGQDNLPITKKKKRFHLDPSINEQSPSSDEEAAGRVQQWEKHTSDDKDVEDGLLPEEKCFGKPLHERDLVKDTASESSLSRPASVFSEASDVQRVKVNESAAKKWSAEDSALLIRLRADGSTWPALASVLKRTKRACQLKYTSLTKQASSSVVAKTASVEQLVQLYHEKKSILWNDIADELDCLPKTAEETVLDSLRP